MSNPEICDRCDPPHNRYAATRRSTCRVGRQGHGDHMWGAGRDRAHLGAVAGVVRVGL